MTTDDLRAAAARWIAGDPDPETRAQLQRLIDAGDDAVLREHVGGTLTFGTAGIRGIVGPGPLRMNRAVVIRTTRGLVDHLAAEQTDGPVVVAFDARPDSRRFAEATVGVVAAAGREVLVFDTPTPTPVAAYLARARDAAAAVVVTASHNPPEYNGYKVYGDGGAQIVPPTDAAIAAAIDAVGPATEVPLDPAGFDADGVERLTEQVVEDYLTDIDRLRTPPADPGALRLVYTPLHGVGWDTLRRAFHRAGYRGIEPVTAQVDPDGAFPTVPFPNPEEPGALDLAIELADDLRAHLVIANDPDADRLAVVVPDDGAWRPLTGNQVGVLLADDRLTHADTGRQPLVASSIVSSPMLGDVAAHHGARWEQTLTGFKWICAAALAIERAGEADFVMGFEEALGYTIGGVVRDKDGISAALVFADLAARLHEAGSSVLERLADLYRRDGLWVSVQHSITRPGIEGQAEIAAAMDAVRGAPPAMLADRDVVTVTDYATGADRRPPWLPATDLLALDLGGGSRVLMRPSGTEPKLKLYVDLRADVRSDDVWPEEAALREVALDVARALAEAAGIG
jgi:phosphomannomutase